MASLQQYQTILYEVQEACKQLSLPVSMGVFDVQSETTLLMGSLANMAGMLLLDNYNWQDLQKPLTITGDGSATQFPLPADFASIVDNTGWANDIRRPVREVNAQQWNAAQSWISNSFHVNPLFRINQNTLEFVSPPGNGTQIKFQYKIRNWVIDGDDQSLKSILAKNADIPRFDWVMMVLAIKVKWLEAQSMNTLAVQSDLNDRYTQLTTKDSAAPVLYLSRRSSGDNRVIDISNVPDTNIGI